MTKMGQCDSGRMHWVCLKYIWKSRGESVKGWGYICTLYACILQKISPISSSPAPLLFLTPLLHFVCSRAPKFTKPSSHLQEPHLKSPPLRVLKLILRSFRTKAHISGWSSLEARAFIFSLISSSNLEVGRQILLPLVVYM